MLALFYCPSNGVNRSNGSSGPTGTNPKGNPMRSEQSVRPAGLLCILLMAGCFFWGHEAHGALAHMGQGCVLAAYEDTTTYYGPRGHTQRPSTERKGHSRFRNHRIRHGVRAGRAHAWVDTRQAVFMASRHLPHQRHGRRFVRKGPAQRVLSARSGRSRFRKTRTLFAQGAKPSASGSLANRGTRAKWPLREDVPTASVPEEAPSSAAAATGAPLIVLSSDGRISANVQNRPLEEMLRLMSEKNLFKIQGPLPTGVLVTLVTSQFSDLTLEEAFNTILAGYN
jgi:hypothetical protein